MKTRSSLGTSALMAAILNVVLQVTLLITQWLDGMTLHRLFCFALTCWIALLNGTYILILIGNYYNKKADGNNRRTTEQER
jgi:uncharacterized membrane protein